MLFFLKFDIMNPNVRRIIWCFLLPNLPHYIQWNTQTLYLWSIMFDIIIKIIKKYPNLFYSQKVIYFIPPLNQFSSPNFPTPTIPTIGKYHAVLFFFLRLKWRGPTAPLPAPPTACRSHHCHLPSPALLLLQALTRCANPDEAPPSALCSK